MESALKLGDMGYGCPSSRRSQPNRFLVEEAVGLPAGRALDLACGEGRNSVWLAEQGWEVTGVDFSPVGIGKARRLSQERGVHPQWIVAHDTDNLEHGHGGPQDPAVLLERDRAADRAHHERFREPRGHLKARFPP